MAEQMNPVAEVIAPDPEAQAAYDQFLPIFDRAYQALVPVFEALV
jgi:sugar (pentulose or hexulose) kinase